MTHSSAAHQILEPPPWAQPYRMYRPDEFAHAVDQLRQRQALRRQGNFAAADAIRDELTDGVMSVRDCGDYSLIAANDFDEVVGWALYFDTALRYGLDVEDVSGSRNRWAHATAARQSVGT